MAEDEQFSLCWNNFNSNLSAGFHESLCRGDLVDVTLAAEGQFIKAHRLVLSVCSPYFRKMFNQMPTNQHAFVFLKDVSHCALKDLIQFMYCGEVNVKQDALPAFISTAEALQIKGLTDSDPAPPQSPSQCPTTQSPTQSPKPSTSTGRGTQVRSPAQVVMGRPPLTKQQRSSAGKSHQQYRIESTDESGDDKTTQIVIQTTNTAPIVTSQPQTIQLQVQQPQQQSQQQTVQIQQQTQKRGAKNNTSHTAKRSKITVTKTDPLEATEPTITVQTVSESKSVVTSEPEFIDLPIDLPTKSEPEYADDNGDVETIEQEPSYVEDDSYGDMKYDEHYFTENDETGGVASSNAATPATTTVKVQQSGGTFAESYVGDAGDQSATEAQESIKFIRSQKKNAQLVYKGYIYNKKLTQANGHTTWRCADVLKLRCKAVCITKGNKLISARRQHIHAQHWQRIGNRPLYDIEEELGEYIEIKADDPKFAEMYQVSHIELAKDQFKIFVPANELLATNKKFETIIEEIIK